MRTTVAIRHSGISEQARGESPSTGNLGIRVGVGVGPPDGAEGAEVEGIEGAGLPVAGAGGTVPTGIAVAVGVASRKGVADGVIVTVGVTVGVDVATSVGAAVAGTLVGVTIAVAVSVGLAVGVGEGVAGCRYSWIAAAVKSR